MASRILLAVALGTAACSTTVRRFPLAPPMWVDPDQNPVGARPEGYYSGLLADGADQLVFRPLGSLFAFHDPGEAVNVNALDEVPNSAWFTNRIGFHPMTPEEVARGSCADPPIDTAAGPWVVVEAKPNGANPGFFIKAPNGRRYLLKADGALQPERNTAADVIGSKLYYAAGYFVACYQIVYFDPRIIEIAKDAVTEDALGQDRPIQTADVEKVLSACARTKEGLIRAELSQFVDGKPLGPFRYEGTRADDPNDVIPHWDRRELRGAKILAGMLGHFDSREQNSLDVWVKDEGREYVRHYYIDFGSAFGSRWPVDQMSRRFGFSYYADWQHMLEDLLSLGMVPRPWRQVAINPGSEIFGYFESRLYHPTDWRGGYPNPTFQRATRRDQLWMARILSRVSDAHLAAAVRMARFSDPRAEAWLLDTLKQRRQRVFEDAFGQDDPLDRFRLVRRTPGSAVQSLCFDDLALKHGVADPKVVTYKMRMMGGEALDRQLGFLQFRPDPTHPDWSCVVLPVGYRRPADLAPPGSADDHPLRYAVLRLFVHQTLDFYPGSEVQVHLYDTSRGFVLAGLHRPQRVELPSDY